MAQPLIFVVDDDDAIRVTLELLLEDAGYAVEVFEHGKAALQRLSAGARPSAIVLDLMMPVMDGVAFLQQRNKRAELRDIPVIVITAGSIDVPPENARVLLKKPMKPDRLLATIAELT